MPVSVEECRMVLYLLRDYLPKANGIDRSVVENLIEKVEAHKCKLTT